MKKIFCAILLAGCLSIGFAQENLHNDNVRVLTVDEAVSLALENNLKIKQSKMDLDVLALQDKYSWNSAAPSFSLSAGMNGSAGSEFGNSDANSSSLGFSISGGVSVNLSPGLPVSIKAAKLAYETGEMTLESTKKSIELSVRRTFYSLVYFNENLELQLRNVETAKQTYESNVKKYNQGRLSELDLLKSQNNYETKIPTIENLKTTYNSNINNFKLDLGIDLDEEIKLTGSLDDAMQVTLDESILQQDVNTLPAVITAKKQIESTLNKLESTKYSAYGPTVSLSVSDGISKTNSKTKVGTTKGKFRNSLSYSASVRIPLDGYLPWSSTTSNIYSQEVNIEKLNQNLESTKITQKLLIQTYYDKINQAKTQLALYEKAVELSQKTYDMTKKAYDMGSSDLLSLQSAEDNLASAKYNVTNQKYTIISSILDLENTLGIPFGTLSQRSEKSE